MKDINLMEILKHNCYITGDANEGEDESVHCSIESVLDAMEQACGELLKIVSEKNLLSHEYIEDYYDSTYPSENGEFGFVRTDWDGMPYAADVVTLNKEEVLQTINSIKR